MRVTRRRRAVIVVTIAVFSIVGAGCGGGSGPKPLGPVGVTHPAAGNSSPGAAVMGFFTELSKGNPSTCLYALQSVAVDCIEALGAESAKFTGLGIGRTTVDGQDALVSVVGTLCITQGSSESCRSNSQTSLGQPDPDSHAKFARLYKSALEGLPIDQSAIPCQQVGGKWYLGLAG